MTLSSIVLWFQLSYFFFLTIASACAGILKKILLNVILISFEKVKCETLFHMLYEGKLCIEYRTSYCTFKHSASTNTVPQVILKHLFVLCPNKNFIAFIRYPGINWRKTKNLMWWEIYQNFKPNHWRNNRPIRTAVPQVTRKVRDSILFCTVKYWSKSGLVEVMDIFIAVPVLITIICFKSLQTYL